MYTENRNKGKFEGNQSELLAETLYDLSLDLSWVNNTWTLPEGCFMSIEGKRYNFILSEDNFGFVHYRIFDCAKNGQGKYEHAIKELDTRQKEWDIEENEENENEDHAQCPMCRSENSIALGTLGQRVYLRCRACGWDYSPQ